MICARLRSDTAHTVSAQRYPARREKCRLIIDRIQRSQPPPPAAGVRFSVSHLVVAYVQNDFFVFKEKFAILTSVIVWTFLPINYELAYWVHFTARFGGVRAFGYNSAESEQMSVKRGTLWVHCRELGMAYFGRDPCSNDILRARENCSFSAGKQSTISPISRRPSFAKFEHNKSIVVAWKKLSKQNFENFSARVVFQKNPKCLKTF